MALIPVALIRADTAGQGSSWAPTAAGTHPSRMNKAERGWVGGPPPNPGNQGPHLPGRKAACNPGRGMRAWTLERCSWAQAHAQPWMRLVTWGHDAGTLRLRVPGCKKGLGGHISPYAYRGDTASYGPRGASLSTGQCTLEPCLVPAGTPWGRDHYFCLSNEEMETRATRKKKKKKAPKGFNPRVPESTSSALWTVRDQD